MTIDSDSVRLAGNLEFYLNQERNASRSCRDNSVNKRACVDSCPFIWLPLHSSASLAADRRPSARELSCCRSAHNTRALLFSCCALPRASSLLLTPCSCSPLARSVRKARICGCSVKRSHC